MTEVKSFNEFLNNKIDSSFKKRIIFSLKEKLCYYDKLPKEIKDLVKFNQIPIDVYQKINDYYTVEKVLPSDSYIVFCKQKLKYIGKKIDNHFLATLGFIELIVIDKFDKYNTIDLYNRMLDEIRSLPDIKNSTDIKKDLINIYKVFFILYTKK